MQQNNELEKQSDPTLLAMARALLSAGVKS